jgi:hypothetical protein
MKKIALLIFLLFPLIGNSQDKNLITGWYGNQNSYMIEYSRNVGYDSINFQKYGFDIGIGYNIENDISKISIGGHGIVEAYSGWNPIYKMGIVLYGVEFYDVFLGGGIEKDRLHFITKLNLINLATGNFKGEWVEFGFGFSF